MILRTSKVGLQSSRAIKLNPQSAVRNFLTSRLPLGSVLSCLVACVVLGPATGSFESKTARTTPAASSARTVSVNSEGWREAAAGYEFRFPADHASHPEYRVEWWYYTGNLETKGGRRFGYQLTFFRTGVVALQKNPKQADAHYYLGVVFDKQGNKLSAEQEYQVALAIQPDLGAACANLTEI